MNDRAVLNRSSKGTPVHINLSYHVDSRRSPQSNRRIRAKRLQTGTPHHLLQKVLATDDVHDSSYLPQHLNAINGRTCSIIVDALNGRVAERVPLQVFLPNVTCSSPTGTSRCTSSSAYRFHRFKDGSAEKHGRRVWSSRYLMIVGCRLLVYRYPISKQRGNANLPLNVIDLTNALITQQGDTVVSISTHRNVNVCS